MHKGFKIAGFIIFLFAANLFRIYFNKSSFYYISFFSEKDPSNVSMPKPMGVVVEKQLKIAENVIEKTTKHPTTSLKTTISFSSSNAEQNKEKPLHTKNDNLMSNITLNRISEILKGGNGIMFVETTDRLQPPSLVLCALESAARVYDDRPVVFFMKGLEENNMEEVATNNFPVLKSLKNLYFFPLRMVQLFSDTPLIPWYLKVKFLSELY